jgi:hypothetical protein
MQAEVPRALLRTALAEYLARTYPELVREIGHVHVRSVHGTDGREYQIEVEVMWDDQPGGAVRVLAAIDDGSFRAFLPLCDDFLMSPDGRFRSSRGRS